MLYIIYAMQSPIYVCVWIHNLFSLAQNVISAKNGFILTALALSVHKNKPQK
jgi:hypothetical protein